MNRDIEIKWQDYWKQIGLYDTPDNPKDKFYLLEMFAYPSGDLHIGHFRNYSIGDAVWRKLRMDGKDILHPFGWDAFGLPAEQAAIKHGKSPEDWTLGNIAKSRSTLEDMAISYDWKREVTTCLPDYYKWTQWVFLKLYEKGLAYRDEAVVNWCPDCKTVLANEQIEGGGCWRCHSEVEKKKLTQWFIKITDYAQRLIDDLDVLEDTWPSNIITMQKNWIGRSEGAELLFPLLDENGNKTDYIFPVFTTRPDTVYGVTFMTIAPEHKLLEEILPMCPNRSEIEKYMEKAQKKSEMERMFTDREADGVFTGLYIENPFNGERAQLWVGDYVLASYGTGIVMAVPAHDERDFRFARKYDIPIKVVIQPEGEELVPENMKDAYTEPGIMTNSAHFDGTPSVEGIAKVAEYANDKGIGKSTVTYRLRDWLVSRQRYWGAPIPMIHCDKCGIVPVPEEDLPVRLPEADKVDFIPKGRSPLEDVPGFINTTCPKCGSPAKRDADTMDTFVCSSWYMLRYPDARNEKQFASKEALEKWMPVDLYIGGAEHANGHLIYFRFITKVLHDMGYVPFNEPAKRLFNHGMVLDEHGDVMSKSKGNVISPADLMKDIGIDAARVALFFFAPSDKEILWSQKSVKGSTRFLDKVWNIFAEGKISRDATLSNVENLAKFDKEILKKLHQALEKYHQDFDRLQFNTCIAQMMEIIGDLSKEKIEKSAIGHEIADIFNRMLAPFAPHIAEEINQRLGYDGSVFLRPFPVFNPELAREDTVTYAVQVMGKLRGTIEAPKGADKDSVIEMAKAEESVSRHIEGKNIVKTIFVQDRIVNFIAK